MFQRLEGLTNWFKKNCTFDTSNHFNVVSGVVAIKCYECNSKLDPRCGDTFNNYTIALVDCDQKKKNDISHIDDEQLAMYNRDVDEEGKYITEIIDKDAKQLSFCRKTMQTSNNLI